MDLELMNYQPAPVTGTDDAQPLWNDKAPGRTWWITDIYIGREGTRRFVPKVNDYVRSPLDYRTWIVRSLDPDTLIPKLDEIRPYGIVSSIDEHDIMFGVGPGTQAQLLRVYVNRSTWPYRLTVDTHCFVGGDNNHYAVLYINGDITMGGKPVSMVTDASGNFVSEKIPLERVTLDTHENHSLKIVQECHTTTDIKDGTPITIVFYSVDDIPQSKAMVLAENTTTIRGTAIQRKFVTHISMESPWISKNDPNVLRFPLNVPMDALGLKGIVHYSDGDSLELEVNGGKFDLMGIDGYISTIAGEEQDLVLRYALSQGEISYAGQGMFVDQFVTEPYKFVTEEMQPGYTVKLFPYPFWDQQLNGYRLRWWLMDLSRETFTDVTQFVEFTPETGAFDPQGYGLVQRKQVTLNLRRVSQSYKPFIHTQFIEVTLFSTPWGSETPWLIANQPMPSQPAYGLEARAKITMNRLNLAAGRQKLDDWLEDIYGLTYPMVDRRSETRPIRPNNFRISVDNGVTWTEYPIERWNIDLNFQRPLTPNDNALIQFIRRSSNLGVQLLSVAAMTMYR